MKVWGKRVVEHQQPGLLNAKQAERFIKLVFEESVLLKQVRVKRVYPWWQVPIREPIARLRVWVARRKARYIDQTDPWWLEAAGQAAARLTRFEDRLLGSPYREIPSPFRAMPKQGRR